MFNSLKKWVRNDDNTQAKQETFGGLQAMHIDLQKKFSKGVQYNLKIIIRGDRNSGKSCLWHRLQGHKFIEEYIPTSEIQVASIHWNYKATDDIVKVDVWDVVDKGKPKQQSSSLKTSHNGDDADDQCMLDASFLDVYKGSHAVLMVFDITKKWTYQYVERELPKVPPHIPVLVMANHRDMGGHRVVDLEEVEELVKDTERPPGSAGIFFLESSMKSGFGLKFVHKFFNVPFLLVQRESLLKQLETNHLDVESCLEELHFESTSKEQSYDRYLEMIEERQKQTKKPNPKPAAEVVQKVSGGEGPASASPRQANVTPAQPQAKNPPSSLAIKDEAAKGQSGSGLFPASMMSDVTSPTEQGPKEPEKRGFMSRFFKGSSATKPDARKNSEGDVPVSKPSVVKPTSHEPINVDEFVPDDDDVDNFLNEASESTKISKRVVESDDSTSDDDEDGGNPMVAGFQEELDSDDQVAAGAHKAYSYSDSDDDYTKSPKATSKHHPVLSRLTPKSPVGAVPPSNDEKLQRLHIDSDTSDDDVDQRPYIMPDEDDVSDGDSSFHERVSNVVVAPVSSDSDDAREITRVGKISDDLSKPEPIDDRQHDDESSSGYDENRGVVSTFVEDVSDENKPPHVDHEAEAQKVTFNLQTSDLDFLEQISTTPKKEKKPAPSNVEKPSRKKKKHKDKDETENVSKKHKHKKKKNKDKKDAGEVKTTKKKSKKSSEKKTAEDAALEEFLASGEGYESH